MRGQALPATQNIKILFWLIDRTSQLAGDLAEWGVWRGRSLVAMGIYLQQDHGDETLRVSTLAYKNSDHSVND